MINRRLTEFDKLAERIAEVVNSFPDKHITAKEVDLRMVALFCYALNVEPIFEVGRNDDTQTIPDNR